MNFKPLADRVLVKRTENKHNSLIIRPDDANEKSQWGTVVAVGPGKYTVNGVLIPMQVKEGDTVFFPRYGGTEVKLEDDIPYIMLNDIEILGKITE